jgi:hypothetical protein
MTRESQAGRGLGGRQALFALALLAGLGAAGAGLAQDPGVEAAVEVTATASRDDIETNAPKWVEEMREKLRGLERLDEAARRGRNGESLECITTNLTASRSLLSTSEAALKTIEGALSRGEMERASFEYRKIAIAVKKSREKYEEGARCAEGEGVRDGKTRREITGEPANPDDDTRGLPNDIVDWGFDPPDASPF